MSSNKIAAGIAVGGVSILVSLILISTGSKPPIAMTGKLYTIDGVEEIVTTNHKENRFFIEGKEVREWEYLDERPKYLAKIEDNKKRIEEEKKAAAEERARLGQIAIREAKKVYFFSIPFTVRDRITKEASQYIDDLSVIHAKGSMRVGYDPKANPHMKYADIYEDYIIRALREEGYDVKTYVAKDVCMGYSYEVERLAVPGK